MKQLLLILYLFFTLTALGQQVYPDSGFTNKAEAKNVMVNGKKEGKWIEISDSMNFSYSFPGNTRYYYDSCYRLTIYKNGVPVGIQRGYYQGGKLFRITPYLNGKINGIETCYDNGDGKLISETPYVNGKINGIKEIYFDNGQVRTEVSYSDSIKNGVTKFYFDNGKTKAEIPFTNDKPNGIMKTYNYNGTPNRETTYVNGKQTLERHYYENGVLKDETPYKNASYTEELIVGIQKEYYDNGKIKTENNYKRGLLKQATFYNINGTIDSVKKYKIAGKNYFESIIY